MISGSSLLLGRSYINLGLDGPLKASGSAFELLAVDLAVSHSGFFVIGGNPRICSGLWCTFFGDAFSEKVVGTTGALGGGLIGVGVDEEAEELLRRKVDSGVKGGTDRAMGRKDIIVV